MDSNSRDWILSPGKIQEIVYLYFRDVDPDPVGSGFIWVRGSGSGFRIRIRIQRYKMKGKTKKKRQQFRKKLYFSSLNCRHSPDKGYSLRFRFRLKNKKFFFTLKICFEINLGILLTWIRTGSGSEFIKFCGSGSEFNQSGSTSL